MMWTDALYGEMALAGGILVTADSVWFAGSLAKESRLIGRKSRAAECGGRASRG